MFVRLFLSFAFICILASFFIYSENGRDLKGKLFRWAEYGNENLTKDEVFELYKSGAYKTERSEDNAYDYENALSYIRYKNKQPCRQ